MINNRQNDSINAIMKENARLTTLQDAEKFVGMNMTTMADVIALDKVVECSNRCQQPVKYFKSLMSTNMKMLQTRQKTCMQACPGMQE